MFFFCVASTTEILPPKCFNGGVPVGDRCKCPSPYTEPFCKEAKNEVVVGKFLFCAAPDLCDHDDDGGGGGGDDDDGC